jgi:hypothetical protein
MRFIKKRILTILSELSGLNLDNENHHKGIRQVMLKP